MSPKLDFAALFDQGASLLVVVAAEPPFYPVVAANRAFAQLARAPSAELIGRPLLDTMPRNPRDPAGERRRLMIASLDRVLATGERDRLPLGRYDLTEHGVPVEHWWRTLNAPLVDNAGQITHLIVRIDDVTELEQTRRLGEVEAQLAALVAAAPDGIIVSDAQGVFLEANPTFERMLGYTRAELLGTRVSDLLPPEELPQLDVVRAKLSRGGVDTHEWRLRHADGTYIAVEVTGNHLADGRRVGFVRDIRDRRALEDALRVSEAQASGIVAISPDAIISVDEQQRITMFNDAAARMFGYTADEALGAPLDMLLPERTREAHDRYVTQFANGTEVARRMGERGTPIAGRRKSGDEFPADAAISKLQVGGRRILTVTLRDVTEQQRAADAERFLAEVGAVLASALEYDDTADNITGLAVKCCRADACALDTFEDGHRRRRIQRRDGTAAAELPVVPSSHLLAFPLRARGEELGTLVFASSHRPFDDDDRQLAGELALRAALALDNARLYRAARKATEARADMLAIVAHDLRNPLNAIALQALLLRSRGDDRAKDIASAIERSARRMTALIADLLDAAQLERGVLSVELAEAEPSPLVREVLSAQHLLAQASGIELVDELPRELPPIRGDRERLVQVFENLIGNALKFTDRGGRISVGALEGPGEVRFWVRDSGCGIPATELPHLFERYWQGQRARRSGIGLGLPIVKGLVEAHGGRIWVESAPGSGTTFWFAIPRALSAA